MKKKSFVSNQLDKHASSFALLNQSMQSFGKDNNYFSQISNCYSNDNQQSKEDILNETLSQTGQFGVQKQTSLCCRTFFTENEIIPQPESMIYEFKCYTFPFSKTKNDMLKKTICAFLNSQGGHLFIGIEQNVETKQHRVRGRVYNQAQKEQVLKVMRMNIESIEPDIVFNNKMEIRFVPVKNSQYPYHYLLGRFVIRIKIHPGVRDQVYTVKTDEKEYIVCVRTQNQVLTYDFKKQPRKLLSIQKQRAQNPYKLINSQRHECKRPQQGARLFKLSHQSKFNEKSKKDQSDRNDQSRKQLNIKLRDRRRDEQNYSTSLEKKYDKKQNQPDKKNPKSPESFNQGSSLQLQISKDKNKKSKSKKQRKQRKKRQKQSQMINDNLQHNKSQESSQRSPQNLSKNRKQKIKRSCFRIIQSYYNKQKNNKLSPKNKKQSTKQLKQGPNLRSKDKQNGTLKGIKMQDLRIQKSITKKTKIEEISSYQCQQQRNQNKKQVRQKSPTKISIIKQQIKSKKARNKQKSRRNCFQSKIYHLQKHLTRNDYPFVKKINNEKNTLNFKQFVVDLLSTNHSSHRFFVFQGFSSRRIYIILQEFTKIGEYNFLQFGDMLLYRFNKETNQHLIKNTLTKAINILKKQKDMQDKGNLSLASIEQDHNSTIVYTNTKKKRDKVNRSVSFDLQQELAYQNSIQSSHVNESLLQNKQTHEDKDSRQKNRSKSIKKQTKRIYKLSAKIKILKYSNLTDEVKSKLKQTMQLIEQLYQKKNIFTKILEQEIQKQKIKKQLRVKKQRLTYKEQQQGSQNQEQISKSKQIQFINVYYSLLAYLELRAYNIDMIFC